MKIALTKDEVGAVIAAHISTIVDETILVTDIDFDKYRVDEFAVWESKKLPEPDDSKYMKRQNPVKED